MLSEGDAAPDFTLSDQNGKPVTLSKLKGETLVLYFYLRADTQVNRVGSAVTVGSGQ